MRTALEQAVLGPVYSLAIYLRNSWWRIRRPRLFGVRVLVIDGERVLLVRHRGGRRPWSLPGGGVERRERMIDAARRECLEETGSAVRIERLMGMYDSFFLGVSNYIAVFVATPLNKPKPPLSVEIAEARFFSMNSLPENTEAGCLRRIAEYRAGRGGLTDMW